MTTTEASTHTHWKLAYLEDEMGKIISEQMLTALWKKIKSAWKDLTMNKNVPRQWGKASVSAKDYVYGIIYKQCPLMELTKNDWKMDELCGLNYPGWVWNNMDATGNWVDTKIIKNKDGTAIGGKQSVAIRKQKANSKSSQPVIRVEKKLQRKLSFSPHLY